MTLPLRHMTTPFRRRRGGECQARHTAATVKQADEDNSQRGDQRQMMCTGCCDWCCCQGSRLVLINEPAQCRGLALTPISL